MNQPQRSQWKTWHKVTLSIIGGLFALILLIVVAANLAVDDQESGNETVDEGIPEGFDAYLAGLDEINPGIREGREDQAVFNDAENLCATINDGADEETLIQGTIARFGVNEAEDVVTEDVAVQILTLTREHCDTIRPA